MLRVLLKDQQSGAASHGSLMQPGIAAGLSASLYAMNRSRHAAQAVLPLPTAVPVCNSNPHPPHSGGPLRWLSVLTGVPSREESAGTVSLPTAKGPLPPTSPLNSPHPLLAMPLPCHPALPIHQATPPSSPCSFPLNASPPIEAEGGVEWASSPPRGAPPCPGCRPQT